MHSVDNRDIVPPGNFEEEEDVGFFCFGYLGTDVEKAENLYFKKEDHALKRTEFLATQQYQNQSDRRSTVWRKSAYYANNNQPREGVNWDDELQLRDLEDIRGTNEFLYTPGMSHRPVSEAGDYRESQNKWVYAENKHEPQLGDDKETLQKSLKEKLQDIKRDFESVQESETSRRSKRRSRNKVGSDTIIKGKLKVVKVDRKTKKKKVQEVLNVDLSSKKEKKLNSPKKGYFKNVSLFNNDTNDNYNDYDQHIMQSKQLHDKIDKGESKKPKKIKKKKSKKIKKEKKVKKQKKPKGQSLATSQETNPQFLSTMNMDSLKMMKTYLDNDTNDTTQKFSKTLPKESQNFELQDDPQALKEHLNLRRRSAEKARALSPRSIFSNKNNLDLNAIKEMKLEATPPLISDRQKKHIKPDFYKANKTDHQGDSIGEYDYDGYESQRRLKIIKNLEDLEREIADLNPNNRELSAFEQTYLDQITKELNQLRSHLKFLDPGDSYEAQIGLRGVNSLDTQK